MWFLFGLVTLALTIGASLMLRGRARWKGVSHTTAIGRQPFELLDEHAHKKRPITRIAVEAPAGFSFCVRDETRWDRWWRAVGVNVERRVHEVQFDTAIYFESDDDRVVAALRKSAPLQQAIRNLRGMLLAEGARSVRWVAGEGRLWIEVHGKLMIRAEGVESIVGCLHQWAAALSAGGKGTRDPFVRRAIVVLSISTGFGVLAAFTLLRVSRAATDVLDPWALFRASLLLGVPLALGFIYAAMRWMRNSARAHRVLTELVLIGLPGIVIGMFALVRDANVALDWTAPRWEMVENTHTVHSTWRCGRRNHKTCHSYSLHLPPDSDRAHLLPAKIMIRGEVYRRLSKRVSVPGPRHTVSVCTDHEPGQQVALSPRPAQSLDHRILVPQLRIAGGRREHQHDALLPAQRCHEQFLDAGSRAGSLAGDHPRTADHFWPDRLLPTGSCG